jgi:acyl-CoA thioesterase
MTQPMNPRANHSIERFERSAVARQLFAYRTLEFDPTTGITRSTMTAGPETVNGLDTVLGGIQTAMLDLGITAAALNLAPPGATVPTLEMKTSFLAPARAGEYSCEAWAARMGRSIGFFEARLRSRDGTVVATGSATLRVIAPRSQDT